jgi:hypothetical protein
LNHYRYSEKQWDLALSTGHPVFIIGNDDMHDLNKAGEVGVRYTMVNSRNDLNKCLDELKKGNAYAVADPDHNCDLRLISCTNKENEIHLKLNIPADKILSISDGGLVRDSVVNVDTAQFIISNSDSYLRFVVFKENCRLYLNPFIRMEAGIPLSNVQNPEINWVLTLAEKFIWIIIYIVMVRFLIQVSRRKRS